MKIALIGLGRMGMNMAKRLLRGGHEVIAYNRSQEKTDTLVKEEGAIGASNIGRVIMNRQGSFATCFKTI